MTNRNDIALIAVCNSAFDWTPEYHGRGSLPLLNYRVFEAVFGRD